MAVLIGGATATLTVGGVDLSDHMSSASLEITADEVETTAFGSATRTRIGGLQTATLTVDFQQDYASSEVDVFGVMACKRRNSKSDELRGVGGRSCVTQ